MFITELKNNSEIKYTWTAKMNAALVFIYLYVYTHIYVTIVIKEKGTTTVSGSKGKDMEEVLGRKKISDTIVFWLKIL